MQHRCGTAEEKQRSSLESDAAARQRSGREGTAVREAVKQR